MGAGVMFPISIKGLIDVPPDGEDAALDRLRVAIAKVQPKDLKRQGRVLTFRGGMFRWVSNWNILVPVDECTVSADLGELRYDCSTRETLIAASVMVAGLVVFIQVTGPASMPLGAKIVVPLVAWLWLFGMNYLISYLRLRKFFARAVKMPANGIGDD